MKVLGTDEEVRERHGATVQDMTGSVSVNESENDIALVVSGTDTISKSVRLTPDEARYLASKLRRVAYRVEARQ